jgi:hypothetical protein
VLEKNHVPGRAVADASVEIAAATERISDVGACVPDANEGVAGVTEGIGDAAIMLAVVPGKVFGPSAVAAAAMVERAGMTERVVVSVVTVAVVGIEALSGICSNKLFIYLE